MKTRAILTSKKVRLGADSFALMLSVYAAGQTKEDFPVGSGECWARAALTVELLDHLPLRYVQGKLRHPEGMSSDEFNPHGFCVAETEEGWLVVDAMLGEWVAEGYGDVDDTVFWEFTP